jgi:phage baseplate assembly protein W
MEYLALPFVLREGYLDRGNLEESITFSVGLILSTRPGAMHFDPEYGCDIWDKEYSDLYTANKADIRASLRNAIDRSERRLYNTSISFINEAEATGQELSGMVVRVTGNYRDEDGEERKYEQSFHLG